MIQKVEVVVIIIDTKVKVSIHIIVIMTMIKKIKAPEIEGIRAQEQGHDNLYDIYVVNNLIEI